MTHVEQIKKRIKYFKMAIVHDEYGEAKWLCDSLTLAVEALEQYEKHVIPAWRDGDMVNTFGLKYIARECLTKISHGHLESRAGGEGKA